MRLVVSIMLAIMVFSNSECQYPDPAKNNVSSVPDTFAINTYRRLMNHNYDLINGKEYTIYFPVFRSNPLFKSVLNCDGTIYYNGRSYSDMKLLYDIYKDELVINYMNSSGIMRVISLNKHCVDSFVIRINNESTRFQSFFFPSDSRIKNGFYEVLYSGKTKLLKKHIKDLSTTGGKDEFINYISRYLYINGTYNRITTLPGFCKLFGNRKTEIRKYARQVREYSFRQISDKSLCQILAYYETLK